MTSDSPSVPFSELGLSDTVLAAVKAIGYESASPIQAATIPAMLAGSDILGQAATGTGKTAAFALPILSMVDTAKREPQALVMVPTRELAIQVAEAFQKYAAGQRNFHVLPIYGGQSYVPQLNALKRGPQVIVGTPGRIIDHLDRQTLTLESIRFVVLDEADEMLDMGFADAMEAILSQTPAEKQVALFSATMAPKIRRIAQTHLKNPREVVIKGKAATAASIKQSYWMVSGLHKLDALTRIAEVVDFDAMLVFVRTKQSTVDLAERLSARGFAAVALNGDIQQSQRERTVAQLKAGKIDILVATDVAARGLDVERITHVINFDVPYDTESYVHRVGRTGRAGRSGEAILFIAPRERNMLRLIEKHTRQTIEALRLPTVDDVNARRLAKFKARIGEALTAGTAEFHRKAIQEVALETGADLLTVAAAVASLVEGNAPVQSSAPTKDYAAPTFDRSRDDDAPQKPKREYAPAADLPSVADNDYSFEDDGKQTTWRLNVGRQHGVQAGNIVGAIANEARLAGPQINGVDVRSGYTLVRLPANLSKAVIERLSKVRVRGQELNLQQSDAESSPRDDGPSRRYESKSFEKKPFEKRPFEKKAFGAKPGFEKKPYEKKAFGAKPSFGKKPYEKKAFGGKPFGKKAFKKREG
jgi:ATP-dependent RNA helicase DeaD